MNLSTIAVYPNDRLVWREWARAKELTSAELMHELIEHVKRKQHQAWYATLPKPECGKPLSNVHLQKKYKNR